MNNASNDKTEKSDILLQKNSNPENQKTTLSEPDNPKKVQNNLQRAYTLAMTILMKMHNSGQLPKKTSLALTASQPRKK